MIITVTLNAAMDKTLAVPNFRLGRRHRAVEQTLDGGRKGRERRARAEVARPAGDRHRRRRRADRHAHHRAAHRGGDPQRLRADPRGVAHLDRRRGRHDRRADGDQRARARRSPRPSWSCSATSCSTSRRARTCASSRAAFRAACPSRLYAELVAELKGMGVTTVLDAEGEPMRLADARRADDGEPERARGRGARGARVRRRRRQARAGSRRSSTSAPREVTMTLPSGCVGARRRRGRPAALPRARSSRARPRSTVGSGDAFLAGYVAARYSGSPADECLRFGVACGAESTQHFGAGVLDPREVERLMPERRGRGAAGCGRVGR